MKKLASFSSGELSILLHATLLLPVVTAMLRIKGFNWTRSHLEGKAFKKIPTHCSDELLVAENTTRLVSVTANNIPLKAKCLKRCLVSLWILAGKGIRANLMIGVNKDGADLDAHAWLELDGQVLNESQNTKNEYKVLDIDFENTNIQNS
jgi:hypothetical protein